MSDREVKTRQSFEEWNLPFQATREWQKGTALEIAQAAWNAALASVETTGRFEVGDRAVSGCEHGTIGFEPDNPHFGTIYDPKDVRPLPKTVELTVEERLEACIDAKKAMRKKAGYEDSPYYASHLILNELANGKSLDQLCSEYGLSTTKELS